MTDESEVLIGQWRETLDARGACEVVDKAETLYHVRFYKAVRGALTDFGDGWRSPEEIVRSWPRVRAAGVVANPAPIADLANLATVARALRTLGLDVPAGVVDAAACEIATMRGGKVEPAADTIEEAAKKAQSEFYAGATYRPTAWDQSPELDREGWRAVARSLLTVATVPAVDPPLASADVCAARHARAVAWGRPADLDVPCDGCNVGATEPCKGTEPATETDATAETWESAADFAVRKWRESGSATPAANISALDTCKSVTERDRQVLARLNAIGSGMAGCGDCCVIVGADYNGRRGNCRCNDSKLRTALRRVRDIAAELRRSAS